MHTAQPGLWEITYDPFNHNYPYWNYLKVISYSFNNEVSSEHQCHLGHTVMAPLAIHFLNKWGFSSFIQVSKCIPAMLDGKQQRKIAISRYKQRTAVTIPLHLKVSYFCMRASTQKGCSLYRTQWHTWLPVRSCICCANNYIKFLGRKASIASKGLPWMPLTPFMLLTSA